MERRRRRRFLSLFQTKVILPGIGDTKTLESLSVAIGEYDRVLESQSTSTNYQPGSFPGTSTNRSQYIQRQRTGSCSTPG